MRLNRIFLHALFLLSLSHLSYITIIVCIPLQNNTLHYVTDGSAKFAFSYRKATYYVPLILMLKCLLDVTDVYIYKALVAGCEDDLYYNNCIMNMLRAVHEEDLHWHEQCKAYLGKIFKVKFSELPADATDVDACDYIIK